jgi:hypothetical protein
LIGVTRDRREATDREIGSVARVRERQESLETQDPLHRLWAESDRKQEPAPQLARRYEELGGRVSQVHRLPWLHAPERLGDEEIRVVSGATPHEYLLLEQPGNVIYRRRFEKPFGECGRGPSPENGYVDVEVDKFGTRRTEDPWRYPGMKPHANNGPARSQSF